MKGIVFDYELMTPIEKALNVAFRFGGNDEVHHKEWVIDQIVRALTGEDYDKWVNDYESGENGPKTYEWGEGIAP